MNSCQSFAPATPDLQVRYSADATVVLSSIARASAGWFSDACVLEVIDGDEPPFRVAYPLEGSSHVGGGSLEQLSTVTGGAALGSVRTSFQAPASPGYSSFAGVLWHGWTSRMSHEQDVVMARLLVDWGMTVIDLCRERERGRAADDKATRLAHDLLDSTVIGEAVGLIMERNGVSRDDAVAELRSASRRESRQLGEVAAALVNGTGQPGARALASVVAGAVVPLRRTT